MHKLLRYINKKYDQVGHGKDIIWMYYKDKKKQDVETGEKPSGCTKERLWCRLKCR